VPLLPRGVRVYVAIEPVNLRKSFDGLTNEVRQARRGDPLCGHVFVFLNRRKTMVKLLVWERAEKARGIDFALDLLPARQAMCMGAKTVNTL
jgi:IS66 Orf2 like protein